MNKKLVALAVAGAFALPLAAQAQTANVTLYGRANLDLEFVRGAQPESVANGIAAGFNPTVVRVASNTSRFGLRGQESLGGGLLAIFQLESNVSWDTGNSSSSGLASRESFVGLQGSWGKVTMGKFLMPQDDVHAVFGNVPTLLTSILSTADVWAQGNLSKGQGGWDARTGNNVRYDSPNWNGFTMAVQYSTQSATGGFNDTTVGTVTNQPPNGLTPGWNGSNGSQAQGLRHANVIGVNGIYTNGPLQLAASGEFNQKVRQYENTVAVGQGCTAASPCIFNANDYDFTVTGAYDFGTIMKSFGLRIGLVYEYTHYQVQNLDASQSALERSFWGVSGTVPIGGGTMYLFWGKAGNGHGSAPAGTTVGYVVSGNNTSTQQWEASYSYSLSPRTLLYTGFVKIANKAYNPTTFNINPYTIQTCEYGSSCNSGQPTGVVFGMVHFF
ncbi:MAG TPA: porin [Casimicrobiaceae bacterium]|jgi:predicted porin|nr:porin [Casimicrobiaceae bacterium]